MKSFNFKKSNIVVITVLSAFALALVYFISTINLEGITVLQQDLQNIQNDMNKAQYDGDPHDNWNKVEADLIKLNSDLSTAYNSKDTTNAAFYVQAK
jgi:hypothetical protein